MTPGNGGDAQEAAGATPAGPKTPSTTRPLGTDTGDSAANAPNTTSSQPPELERISKDEVTGGEIQRLADPPARSPYNPQMALDDIRRDLARWLVQALFLVIVLIAVGLFTARWTKVSTSDMKSIFVTMFASLVTLVSAATGFYFGAQMGTTIDKTASTDAAVPRARPLFNLPKLRAKRAARPGNTTTGPGSGTPK